VILPITTCVPRIYKFLHKLINSFLHLGAGNYETMKAKLIMSTNIQLGMSFWPVIDNENVLYISKTEENGF
jgi:hypothetical protein